jgi:hypothetical protein
LIFVCQCCCLSKSGLNSQPRCLGSSSAGSMPGRVFGLNVNVSDAAGGFPRFSDGLFEIWLLTGTSCIVVPLYELYRMSSGRPVTLLRAVSYVQRQTCDAATSCIVCPAPDLSEIDHLVPLKLFVRTSYSEKSLWIFSPIRLPLN